MKTRTKALLGGGALLAVGATGAGGYHVHNNIIPEMIASEMTRTYQDAHGMAKKPGAIQTKLAGPVSVRVNGFLDYRVSVPSVQATIKTDDGGKNAIQVKIKKSDHKIAFGNFFAALGSALGIGNKVDVTLTATSPVQGSIVVTEGVLDESGSREVIKANIVCHDVTNKSTIKGKAYSLKTNFGACRLTGSMKEADGTLIIVRSGLSGFGAISKDGTGKYSGAQRISMKDVFVQDSRKYGGEWSERFADNITIANKFENMNTPPSAFPRKFGLKDLPNTGSFRLDVNGLRLNRNMSTDLTFGVTYRDIKTNAASIGMNLAYALKGSQRQAGLSRKQSCKVALGGLPMKKIGPALMPHSIGDMTEQKIMESFKTATISFDLDCKASQGDKHGSSILAKHRLQSGAFPGNGLLTVKGYDSFSAAVFEADLFGLSGPIVGQLNGLFMQLAKPTKDGKGHEWKYKLDDKGNLTVNGQKIGPVLAPR